jgi:thioredoxin reductase (NADPH)
VTGLKLTLLGRAYCHLCDEMLDALRPLATRHGATVTVVDVDAEPALEQAFGDRVPLLFAGDPASGAELCCFRLDRARVEAALTEEQAARN